jgi:hypothetical protein
MAFARLTAVMAGLGPAIHVLTGARLQSVDARDKPAHDGWHCLTAVMAA